MKGLVFPLIFLAVAALAPRVGGLALWRRYRAHRDRARAEDALKHILAWKHRSQLASLESLAGTLRLRPAAALRLASGLQSAGWIEIGAAGIGLTPGGERRALQVVRAHRLWERHLSDDANMPMSRLHAAAERAEHNLSSDELAELDAHLGHPEHDPHGDPIPRADGRLATLDAVSLNEWPAGRPARIVHVEDEPETVFARIIASGLRPAQTVQVAHAGRRHIVLNAPGRKLRIQRAVAANIHVAAADEHDRLPADAVRLSDLSQGETGHVLELGPGCHGFSRRRLLDLGLTPGSSVEAAFDNTFGDPRAFRVRGTTVALRTQQAEHVWVRRSAGSQVAGGQA